MWKWLIGLGECLTTVALLDQDKVSEKAKSEPTIQYSIDNLAQKAYTNTLRKYEFAEASFVHTRAAYIIDTSFIINKNNTNISFAKIAEHFIKSPADYIDPPYALDLNKFNQNIACSIKDPASGLNQHTLSAFHHAVEREGGIGDLIQLCADRSTSLSARNAYCSTIFIKYANDILLDLAGAENSYQCHATDSIFTY